MKHSAKLQRDKVFLRMSKSWAQLEAGGRRKSRSRTCL